MEALWHIKVVYEAQFVLVVCSDWWYAICHCFICCGMFVINVCCETVLNVFHLNHLLLITSFSVYESKVVYTCLQKNSSFWSSPITLNGVTERVSAQNLSAIYIENRRESWAVCNATLNITLKHVIWHSCFLFYCFAFANNRIFFFFSQKQALWDKEGTSMQKLWCVRSASVGGIFADVLYQCFTSSSENNKKCMHHPQEICILESAECTNLKQTVCFVSFWLIGNRILFFFFFFPHGPCLLPSFKIQVKEVKTATTATTKAKDEHFRMI